MLFDHLFLLAIVAGASIGLGVMLLFIRYTKFSYICLFFSIAAGQLARISLGTDTRGGSAIILTDIIILLIGLAWIIRKLVYERHIKAGHLAKPLLLFITIAFLSYIFGLGNLFKIDALELKALVVSFSYWFRFVAYALLYFITKEFLAKDTKHETFLMRLIFITSILVSIGGFIQLIVMPDFTAYAIKYGWDPHQNRLLGTFFDPNFIGSYFAMILALGLSIFPTASKKFKVLLVFSILFCSVALLLTFSRTGYVAFFVALLIIGMIRSPKLLVIGVLCTTLAVVASPRAVQRITDGLSVDATGLKRVESWNKGMKLLANYPLLGVGYNNLPQVQDYYALVDQFDVNNRSGFENTLLTILVTTGILGGLSYTWLWFLMIKDSFVMWARKKMPQVTKNLGLGLGTAFISLVVSSIFMNSLLYPFLLVHIWILASFIPSPYATDRSTND